VQVSDKIQAKIAFINKVISAVNERLTVEKDNIQSRIFAVEGNYFDYPEKQMEFQRLKYIEELNNRYFTLFTEKKIEYELSNAGYFTTNRILSVPKVPQSPIRPRELVINAVFIGLGFLLGIGLLVFRYLTFNEILNVNDLTKLLPDK
ncbi:MAG: hypothetical protein ACKPFK_13455, partial [Dolichospermum sp.]